MSEDEFNRKKLEASLLKCLTECNRDEIVTVVTVNAGYKAKMRLANLGIVPGVKIKKKKSAPLKGPIEIIVKGSSLVIGRGIATKIIVTCSDQCKF
ncbi:MAG: ferrous iron transport protein A [Candidatus Heimdallarchaeota archaeon]